MPWTIDIQRDIDKTDVGSVAATFIEPSDASKTFTYSDRIRLNAAGRDAFFANAYAARNAWRIRTAWEATNETSAASLMNTNDPNP